MNNTIVWNKAAVLSTSLVFRTRLPYWGQGCCFGEKDAVLGARLLVWGQGFCFGGKAIVFWGQAAVLETRLLFRGQGCCFETRLLY